jgi:hypothetical protein
MTTENVQPTVETILAKIDIGEKPKRGRKKTGVTVRPISRSGPRMQVKPDEVIEYAALMIAVIGKRNNLTRWQMRKSMVRELCQTGIRSRLYDELSDCLSEYGVMMMDVSDKYFAFLQTDKTNSWRHVGLKDLTEEERRNPNMEAMEKEIGYVGPWDAMTDEERAEYEDA